MEEWRQIVRVALCRNLALYLSSTAIAIVVASTAAAQNSSFLPDFSATEVAHVRGREIASKVYRSGLNFRSELAPGNEIIYLTASNKLYWVVLKGTQCIETTGIRGHLVSPLQLFSEANVQRKSGGTEVIEGHPCTIEDVVVTGPDGKTNQLRLWEATDLSGVPVKIEAHFPRGEFTTTYRDIVVGTPDAALFTPPKNCKPFEKTYQIAPPGK